jgi:hypothetical protein
MVLVLEKVMVAPGSAGERAHEGGLYAGEGTGTG